MMNIVSYIVSIAKQLNTIDSRIVFLPLSLHFTPGGAPHVLAALHVENDQAVRDLAMRSDLGEPTLRCHGDSEWLVAEKWVEVDGVHLQLSFSGPHRRKLAPEAS